MKVVKMQDGREVKFGDRMKRRTEVLDEGARVRFDYPNGETRIWERDRCDSKTRDLLTAHGASQKIGDECADLDSVEECISASDAMIARLYAGTAFDRIGGGGFVDTTLIQALVNLGADRDEATETVKGATSGERAALRQVEAIKAEIDKIEAAKPKADVTHLLGKFGL